MPGRRSERGRKLNPFFAFAAVAIAVFAVACGGSGNGRDSPALRAAALATPEAAAAAPSDADLADLAGTPAYCVTAEHGTLQDISTTPASPYLIRHPEPGGPSTPTVIFMPGGSGNRNIALRAWANFLSGGAGADRFRLVVPYAEGIDRIDDAQLVFGILDEVLACYGGDASPVHIGGTSNGGLASFALMLARPELFASLLGAPGGFPTQNPALLAAALSGKRVFNGVGANDNGWKPGVTATHDLLTAIGVKSVFVEFASQGHQVSPEFDESVFFKFWRGEM